MADDRPCLHVCTTCKQSGGTERDTPSGRRLHDALEPLLSARAAPARLEQVVCFANCERGCTAALSQAGKWTYMMGHLGPEHAEDLVAWAQAYAASSNGTVLRSRRPDSLRHTIVARFPGAAPADSQKDAAE